jgi:hypothetical protein
MKPKKYKQAEKLNDMLKTVASEYGLDDFGGGNFLVPLPEDVTINGKVTTLYAVVFNGGDYNERIRSTHRNV